MLARSNSATPAFQSTLPYGSDSVARQAFADIAISIHAPLRERLTADSPTEPGTFISIHAPLRERHATIKDRMAAYEFQSTLPYGSDAQKFDTLPVLNISIHAPLRERLSC